MAGGEKVVGALVHARESREPALAAQRRETVQALGEQFVGVALVSDVEDYLVRVGIEYAQQRHRQFDGAER